MLRAALCMSLLMFLFSASAETRACAHRGDAKAAPENTLPAIQSAVDKGAAMIEFDVGVSKDGQLVVIHDNSVDRTTSGKGKISELTFDEIRALDAGSWFDPKFAGTKVPTPREVLELIPRTILCNVHLKSGAGVARKTALLLKEMDRMDHCFLAATTDQAAEARAAVLDVKICNMATKIGDRPGYIAETIGINANFIQLFYGDGMEHLKEDVAHLHESGLQVNWYGASKEEPIRQLAEAGVNYILTDDLDLCLKVLDEYKEK